MTPMADIIVIAHVGNVLVSMIYLAPVLILVGALAVTRRLDDRRADEDDEHEAGDLVDLGD